MQVAAGVQGHRAVRSVQLLAGVVGQHILLDMPSLDAQFVA